MKKVLKRFRRRRAVLAPHTARGASWARVSEIVRARTASKDGVSAEEWRVIEDATMELSAAEAELLYKMFVQISCNQSALGLCVTLFHCSDAQLFASVFLENGRWINYLSDVLEEPDIDRRKNNAVERRRKHEHDIQRHSKHAETIIEVSRMRREHRRESQKAFARCKNALRTKLPDIIWNDISSTPRQIWNQVQTSRLSTDECLALDYATNYIARVPAFSIT